MATLSYRLATLRADRGETKATRGTRNRPLFARVVAS
jgi:hypothetical protein